MKFLVFVALAVSSSLALPRQNYRTTLGDEVELLPATQDNRELAQGSRKMTLGHEVEILPADPPRKHRQSLASKEIDLLPENAIASVTSLNDQQLDNYRSYALFAQAAYCGEALVKPWSCPGACKDNDLVDFKVEMTGGNGADTPFHFVGHWPKKRAVVVSYEGTNPQVWDSVYNDLVASKRKLAMKRFPGMPSGVEVHEGFADAHARTADEVLEATKKLLKSHGLTKVMVTGHSLGGAMAALGSLFLKMNLGAEVHVEAVTFGMPRVGNDAFARFFDKTINDFKRVNAGYDPVPHLPLKLMGFLHPKGEVHIFNEQNAVMCPGNDYEGDERCTAKTTIGSLVHINAKHHAGVYPGGVRISRGECGLHGAPALDVARDAAAFLLSHVADATINSIEENIADLKSLAKDGISSAKHFFEDRF
ncbi:hypothetical protein HGRIS_013847 [Hohenbuehelia grisea]|uniref:Fungal lipase-type domain-containing protein n=1 Tax=Hohenbuehelia grisea TaxID=104357 RepID=A0ABR3IX24_9AGAR